MRFLIEAESNLDIELPADDNKLTTSNEKRMGIYSDDFTEYSKDLREQRALTYLKSLPNYNKALKNADKYYSQAISDIDSSNKRGRYLDYIKKLNIPFSIDTAEIIDDLADQNLLDYEKDINWLNNLNINQDGSAIRNTIKTIAFFNNKDNRQRWGVDDSIVEDKLLKNNKPIPYSQIANIVDEIQSKNKGRKSETSDAIMTLVDLKLNRKTATELINRIYRAGDNADSLVQKALKAMGESSV